MKTKIVTMYECEVCGYTSFDKKIIEECEQRHRDVDAWFQKQPKWGQELIEEAGSTTYKRALELLEESDNAVEIYETDELGFVEWAVAPIEDISFWLNTFKNRKDAEYFCKEMGWKYEN
jgi:predicted metal-dependent peptidase